MFFMTAPLSPLHASLDVSEVRSPVEQEFSLTVETLFCTSRPVALRLWRHREEFPGSASLEMENRLKEDSLCEEAHFFVSGISEDVILSYMEHWKIVGVVAVSRKGADQSLGELDQNLYFIYPKFPTK